MPVVTDLDQPEDITIACGICRQPLRVTHHLILNKWIHPTVHEECADRYEAQLRQRKVVEPNMPERFREKFDQAKFKYPRLIQDATEFGPDSQFKTLAIVGDKIPQGKSRLMWNVIQGFFVMLEHDRGTKAWVEYALFTDLVSELDRALINRLRVAKYVFVDNVGCCECLGSARAAAQQLIRSRIERGQWLFLTVDDMDSFDRGLEGFLTSRAVTIVLPKE